MKAKRKDIDPDNLKEAIGSIWGRMGFQSVGEPELVAIQKALGDELSPASIARELASAGAELRHPEIIECDAQWRERQIAKRTRPLAGVSRLLKRAPFGLKDAETAIAKFEALRLRAADEGDEATLSEIKRLAIDARRSALKCANDPSLPSLDQEQQKEIAEWFRVWLETPQIFLDWLELRKSSTAFQNKFAKD
jgi:hypothetical protein